MCTVAPKDLIQLIAGVRTRHPGIQVDLVNATAPELDEALRSGELELAILCKAEDDRDDAFHYQPLFREQFVIATAPDHPFARKELVRVADLGKEPYLRRINCEFGEIAGRVFRSNGCMVQTVYKSERDDWILAMAAAGMGFAFLPRYCADHPGVVVRPLVDPEFWREVSLVTVRGRQHSPAVGALVHEAMQATWKDGVALSVETFSRGQKDAG